MNSKTDIVVCARLLVKDFDPKEDHPHFGGAGYAPEAVDGLNMIHSLNRMADLGQAGDQYVNGRVR